MGKEKMHLVGFMLNSPMNHSISSWTHPRDKVGYSWAEPEMWQDIARTLERGKFDCLFLADVMAPFAKYKDRMDEALRYAIQFPVHDPLVLIPAMSVVTRNLGFAVTASTTYTDPYSLARRFSTLDHLTKGRIGWNVVTSVQTSEARNFGQQEVPPHVARYARAHEFLEVCNKLWSSWEPDAVVMDKEAQIFTDPAKVKRINHKGEFYNVAGPLCCAPSPQGRPVIIQAGASEQGRDYAAQHAEYVFGIQLNAAGMRAFSSDIRKRAVDRFDRKPTDIKILYGVQIILGHTESEARAKQKMMADLVPLEAAMAILSGHLNFDWSSFDLDAPLENIEIEGVQGILDALTGMVGGGKKLTLREAAMMHGRSVSMPQIVGTAEQVSDQLELMRDEGGGDGFQITPTYVPGSFQEIVDGLVPVLQKRGLHREGYTGATLREHLREF